MDATWKALDQTTGNLHREACFTDPARACDCDQAHILTQQEFSREGHFVLPAHETGPLHRKIRRPRLHLLSWLLREAVAYGCQIPCEIAGGTVTLIRLFRQAPLDSPTQRSGSIAVLRSERLGLFPENGYHGLRRSASLEGALSRHHLVEHQAQRELV